MIRVVIETDKSGDILSYQMSGHANFQPHGEDIVCAAASVLGYTALNSLIEIAGVSEKNLDYDINEKEGYLKVSLEAELHKSNWADIQIILKTYEVGIRSMIESYPKYITLEYRGGGTRV